MSNKVKIILFDIDKVLIHLPYYFSRELVKLGYGNADSVFNDFYAK